MRLACVALVSGFLGLVWLLASAASDEDIEAETGILSRNIVERAQAAKRLRRQRAEAIDHLVSVLDHLKLQDDVDDSFFGARSYVIQILGEYRAEQAVPILVSGITFIPSGFELDESIPAEAYNLCAVALRDIGRPAIPRLTRVALHAEAEDEWRLAAWVLAQIEGVDEAEHRLTRVAKETPRLADRCEKAIQHMKAPPSEHRDPTDGKGRPGEWK